MAEIFTEDSEAHCDGCGLKIQPGVPYLSDIDSCCGGGCTRSLCAECVKKAATDLGLIG